jgi:hypothetical protein
MKKYAKFLELILTGRSDANTSFNSLCRLLYKLGFEERIRGDHHIFTQPGVEEIINLQPRGPKAKLYQVKQVRNLILKYRLGDKLNEENDQI